MVRINRYQTLPRSTGIGPVGALEPPTVPAERLRALSDRGESRTRGPPTSRGNPVRPTLRRDTPYVEKGPRKFRTPATGRYPA